MYIIIDFIKKKKKKKKHSRKCFMAKDLPVIELKWILKIILVNRMLEFSLKYWALTITI